AADARKRSLMMGNPVLNVGTLSMGHRTYIMAGMGGMLHPYPHRDSARCGRALRALGLSGSWGDQATPHRSISYTRHCSNGHAWSRVHGTSYGCTP
ncbi:MAG: hypothetical protein QXU32_02190, partial [Nitrososphaerales archaeon]